MERFFDNVSGRYPRERIEAVWGPPVDVDETDEAITVRAELPGMNKDDIKVNVMGDTVTISGERKHDVEQKGRTFHRIERLYGRFQRGLTLPCEVDSDKAKATYRNGVLELVLPKSARTRAREISIKAEE
jgi:HSP20 family protein